MPFNLKTWQTQVQAQLKNWRNKMKQAGIQSIYAFISASALWPIIAATRAGDWGALSALGGVLAGLGTNLLANRIQSWKDQTDAAHKIEQDLSTEPGLQKEIDEILEKLEVLTLARLGIAEPDRQWYLTTLKAELTQLGSLPRFDSFFRNVVSDGSINDSIIVTGDNVSVTKIVNQYLQEGRTTDPEVLCQQIASYLTWLRERCGTIELRGIKREGQQVVQLDLNDVYVPLAAEAYHPFPRVESGKKVPKMASQDPDSGDVGLDQVLKLAEHLIITGGPGCGKTTVLLYIAWVLANAILLNQPQLAKEKLALEGDPALPIFVPLSSYAAFLRQTPETSDSRQKTLAAFISRFLIEKQTSFDLPADFFAQLIKNGHSVILLLDGLDEVPNEDERAQVRQAIEDLITGRNSMRVVATCRTAAYKDRTALGKGFREVRVKPLNPDQVAALVQKAYQHIYRHDPDTCNNKIIELVSAIRNLETQRQERLGKDSESLVTSPLLVRMLLVVHFSERRLPEQRAELYMKATDAMLLPEYAPDEAIAAQIGRLVGGSREIHRDLAQQLAFNMHGKGVSQGRELSEAELRRILGENTAFKPLIEDFISLTRLRGTLLEERLGSYRFIHLAFQEYLAARYLAEIKRGEAGVEGIAGFLEAGPILDSWWREPALLIAGYLSVTSPQTAQLFLQRLAGADEKARHRNKSQFGDLQLTAAEIAACACLEWQKSHSDLQDFLRIRLVELLNDKKIMFESKPILRCAAANALARLGDPRAEVMTLDAMQFCYVPAGPFQMGGESSWYSAKPVHLNEILDYIYWLSKYPITNAQFQAFIDDKDGWDKEAWWTSAGLRWRDKKQKTERYGGDFDLANHPVVGVRWYEALAFTRWLTQRWHKQGILRKKQLVTLPSEAEWEKAARGGVQIPSQPLVLPVRQISDRLDCQTETHAQPKRAYPWGEAWDANRANGSETGIGSTSVVGCFPGGASPYGCEELIGNVWEWTRSLWGKKGLEGPDFKYPYQLDDGREYLAVGDDVARVVRGGAFVNVQVNLRSAVRFNRIPHYLYNDVGFRLVWRAQSRSAG